MLTWLREAWQRMTTTRCATCGSRVRVTDYVRTGETRKSEWWTGVQVELACPECGATFWVRR